MTRVCSLSSPTTAATAHVLGLLMAASFHPGGMASVLTMAFPKSTRSTPDLPWLPDSIEVGPALQRKAWRLGDREGLCSVRHDRAARLGQTALPETHHLHRSAAALRVKPYRPIQALLETKCLITDPLGVLWPWSGETLFRRSTSASSGLPAREGEKAWLRVLRPGSATGLSCDILNESMAATLRT